MKHWDQLAALYKRGQTDADFDPRGCDEWQTLASEIKRLDAVREAAQAAYDAFEQGHDLAGALDRLGSALYFGDDCVLGG